MLLPSTRAVFFDAVGTLIHPVVPPAQTYLEVGRRYGSRLGVSEIAVRFRQAFVREEVLDRQEEWRTSEAREQKRWQNIVKAVLDDVADAEGCFHTLFEHFARPEAWRCEPGTAELLKKLSDQGVVVGIASNYDRRLRQVVAGLPELKESRHVVISSEVGARKPSAEFFRAVCERAGLPPGQVAYVGDDPDNDYQGAAAAGLTPVLLDPDRRAGIASIFD